MHKVLILGTYPSVAPRHGGQKRSAAIINTYRSLGCSVQYVGIYPGDAYKDRGKSDIIIRSEKSLKSINVANAELTGDLATGWVCCNDEEVYNQLVYYINKFKPDIIQVEQPYLFPFLNRAKEAGLLSGRKIVYSSHNIEHTMKQQMLTSAPNVSSKRKAEIVDQVLTFETNLATLADAVIAVTNQDAQALREWGAKKTIVAPNGIDPLYYDTHAIQSLRRFYHDENIERTVLFVGSWHLPNWQGFQDMIGTKLGYVPHGVKIIIIGGIAGLIKEYFQNHSVIERTCFYQRAEVLGNVSEARLRAAIALADLVVLPITTGGGSNLKTAEAIMSGKNVLATPYAFRGYDELKQISNINLEKTSEGFHNKLSTLIYQTPAERSEIEQAQAESVLWSNTLRNLEEIVR